MKKRLMTLMLAGSFLATVTVPALAGPGGKMSGQGQQIRTQQKQQVQDQQRLRDGSCANPAQMGSGAKKGNTYGPGDGTGNSGFGPKDGTGYGAPSTR